MKYICDNIKEIPKLFFLELFENEITDIGGELLLETLPKLKHFGKLYTHHNKISNYDEFKRKMKEKHPNKSLKIDIW